MKTLTGFALGTLVSLGIVTSAAAAGASFAAPVQAPPAGIEVIVVTAKRPVVQPVDAGQPIYEVIVTAKRPGTMNTDRTPPVITVELPIVELAIGGPRVLRL